jgi:multidrug resistance efflux pump
MRISRRDFVFFAMSAWLGSLAGCSQPAAPPPPDAAKENAPAAAVTVKVIRPERRTMAMQVEQPGHIEAFESTPIFAKIPGYVSKVHVDIEATVEEGQPLLELSVPEMVEDAKQRKALAALAREQVREARQALRVADAKVENAMALCERWEREYARVERLVRDKALDEQTRDETRYQFKAAEAARKECEARRELAQVEIDACIARQQAAEAEQMHSETLLEYAQIKSPYPGVVTLRNVHTGHFVQPPFGDKREPLLVVERRDKYRVVVEVSEAEAALIRTGDSATIYIPKLGGQQIVLPVERTAWSLDSKTRTLRAELDWNKPDERVRPGHFVAATIVVEHKNVWTLPEPAVLAKDGQASCWRLREGRLVRTPLQLCIKQGGRVEVLEPTDWKDTDEIVATNPGKLEEGQAVNVAP